MRRKITRGGVFAVLLLLATGALPHIAAAGGTAVYSNATNDTATVGAEQTLTNVSASNLTYVTTPTGEFATVNGMPYYWRSTSRRFDAGVSVRRSGAYALCLSTDSGSNRTAATCERFNATVNGNQSNTTVVSVAPNRTRLTGASRVTITLKNATDNTTLDTATVGIATKSGDLDGDGLSNERELAVGTNVSVSDSDGDGLADGPEVKQYKTSPITADSDGDGLADGPEVKQHNTSPTTTDTDGDGLRDGVEVNKYGTNPTAVDSDSDGLDDDRELALGTNPTVADTDDDGLNDHEEVSVHGTDPVVADTDGDGLDDGAEVNDHPTNPTDSDTDGDGLSDGVEVQERSTDPVVADTDGDGLDDGEEVNEYGTDATAVDSDGDFLSDETEVKWGVDPTNPLSPAWIGGSALGFWVGVGVTVVVSRREWTLATLFTRFVLSHVRRFVHFWTSGTSVNTVKTVSDSDDPTSIPAEAGEQSAVEAVESTEIELVSDAELVERMLRAESGRLRQSEIVRITGWSKAKVSRRLSTMADDGVLTKVQIGRENLICLDGAVPELAMPREASASARAGRLGATAAGQ